MHTHAVLLLCIWLSLTYMVNSSENLVLNHYEGDKVFIPCFNTPLESIVMWKINGSLYHADRLPQELYLHSFPNGIYVEYTTFKITGKLICFTMKEKLLPISSVMFVVHKRNLTGNNINFLNHTDASKIFKSAWECLNVQKKLLHLLVEPVRFYPMI